MNSDVVTVLALALGMALYLLVCIPAAKWLARRLTGRPFEWRLRPEYPRVEGQWRDIAWSAGALIAAMALLGGVMELLGWGP